MCVLFTHSDPLHNDHLYFVQTVIDAAKLDLVILIPAFVNPLKTLAQSAPLANAQQRFTMVYNNHINAMTEIFRERVDSRYKFEYD